MRGMGSRLTALCLALLLQAFLAALLFQAVLQARRLPAPAREMIWIFPPKPAEPREKPRRSGTASGAPTTAPIIRTIPAPLPAPSLPPISGLQGFGRELNGCQPEKLASLPPEQRAACMNLAPKMAKRAPDADLMGAPSHVKDPARWQAELARKQSPALMPCMGGLDVMCVLMKMADGSLSDFGDPKTWPIYQTKQLAPEDFYKIEQAYAEWHKDHPAPPAPASAPH